MLEIKNLTKKFGEEVVLKDVSLKFPEGKTTVIVGPSGSGKSTLLRLIDLLETPETGSITIGNNKIEFPATLTFKEKKEYRKYFSVVFQSYNLFPHLTVLRNVMEGLTQVKKITKASAKDIASTMLNKIGLGDKQTSYPSQLSGGQQQRVAIVRALVMEPTFILYDEPTSALDPELANEVLMTIQRLAETGNSQIIVTHNLEFARRVANRVIFMNHGEILFDGDTEDFFSSDESFIKKFIRSIV